MEEKKYPIYRLSAVWDQKDFENNSTCSDRMFENKLTEDELN